MQKWKAEKNRLGRLAQTGYSVILILLALLLACVGYQSFCDIQEGSNFVPSILILGTIVYLAFLYRASGLLDCFTERVGSHDVLAGGLICLCFFILLSVCADQLTVLSWYDLKPMEYEAHQMVLRSKDASYSGSLYSNPATLSQYSAQIPATLYLYFFNRLASLFGWEDYRMINGVLNSLSIALAAYGAFFVAKELRSVKTAFLVLLIFVMNPVFYIYASYAYTDTLSIPYALWGGYLLLKAMQPRDKNKDWRKRFVFAFCGMALLMIGFQIRATVGIVMIAFLVYAFAVRKERLVTCTAAAAAVLIILLGKNAAYGYFGVEVDQNAEFPVTHWLMMGVNEESAGGYNTADVNYTISFETYEEKVEANVAEIKTRISNMGISRAFNFIYRKLRLVWSSGDCTQQTWKSMEHQGRLYDYTVGNKNLFFQYYTQISRCALLVGIFFCIVRQILLKNREISPWVIALFGAFLFYLIWEAKRKYSLNFMPWMFLLMAEGVEDLQDFAVTVCSSAEETYRKAGVRRKLVGAFPVLLTLCAFAGNYNAMTVSLESYDDLRLYHPSSNLGGSLTDIGLSVVEQTFCVDRSFNVLTLYFVLNEEAENENYQLKLTESESDKLLYEIEFSVDAMGADGTLELAFDEIVPDGMTEYCLSVCAVNPTGETSIGIAGEGTWNHIPDGAMYVDGTEMNSDLKLSVTDRTERTYTTGRVFLFLAVIVLLAEIFAFGLFPEKRQLKNRQTDTSL